jgi:hypothetical protein
MQRIVCDASLVVVCLEIFRRGGPERTRLAHSEESSLAKFVYTLREILVGLPDVACSSAPAIACSNWTTGDWLKSAYIVEKRARKKAILGGFEEVTGLASRYLRTARLARSGPHARESMSIPVTGPKTLLNETI